MVRMEKAKIIDTVLRMERFLEGLRRKRSTIILAALLALGGAFSLHHQNGTVADSPSASSVLDGNKSDIGNDGREAESQEKEASAFSRMLARLGDPRAMSLLQNGDSDDRQQLIFKVPADFDTIQKAIDAAVDGDVVLVSAGEYKETILMKDGVSVIGEKAETTIIDADKQGNAVTFKDVSNPDTRLENFSIKNAQANLSGILVEDSSPIINRNVIFGNDYDIYIKGKSSPVIQRNVIEQGKAGVQIFNLMAVDGSNPVISDNLIYGNKKGINLYNGNASIEHNTISYNIAYGLESGATFGIYMASSSAVIRNNIITDNGICEICSGIYADDKSQGVQIGYNDLWNNQSNFICFGSCTMEDNNRSEDPLFQNGLLYDFNLKAESPLSAAGSDGQKLGARI